MTTEIAVLNRLGVALATDSTVTISGINNSKTFDSADKLFELHCKHPVAAMVNGNLDLYGIPWEILVKDFRDDRANHENVSIPSWAAMFLAYTEARKELDEGCEKTYIEYCVEIEADRLKRITSSMFWENPKKWIAGKTQLFPDILSFIAERRKWIATLSKAESLKDFTSEALRLKYKNIIEAKFKSELLPLPLPLDIVDAFAEMLCELLLAETNSDYSTGLIFSGYGKGDVYPSVYAIEIDGYVNGKLKHLGIREVAKINNPSLGYAQSFADDDVIERLLNGVDPRFVSKTSEFLTDVARQASDKIALALFPKMSGGLRGKKKKEILGILEILVETFSSDAAKDFKEEFRQDFDRMIAMMPKIELIELAEALISITAIEKKTSGEDRSVGGPIDVAFITKHEALFQTALEPTLFLA